MFTLHRWKCLNCDTIFVIRHPSYPNHRKCDSCGAIGEYEKLGKEIPFKYRDDPKALKEGLPYVKRQEEARYNKMLEAREKEKVEKEKKAKRELKKLKKAQKENAKKKSKPNGQKKEAGDKKPAIEPEPADKPPPAKPKLPDFPVYGPKTWLKKMRELSEKENKDLHQL